MLSFIKTISKIAIVTFCCIFLTGSFSFSENEPLDEGIITAKVINIRSGPGIEYPALFLLKKNTRVTIVEKFEAWLKISYKGKTGFIRNREIYIKIIDKSVNYERQNYTATVVSEWLNVREVPDANYKAAFILKKGTQVTILEQKGSWLKIKCNDKTGYIKNRSKYITISTGSIAGNKDIPSSRQGDMINDTGSDKTVSQKTENDSEEIYNEIKKHQDNIIIFTEKERSIIKQLNNIEKSLNQKQIKISQNKKKLIGIIKQIQESEHKIEKLKSIIQENEPYVKQRLISIYKLQNIGNLHFLASADSIFDFFRQKKLMDVILQSDAEFFEKHMMNIKLLSEIKENYVNQQENLLVLQDNLKSDIESISVEKNNRQKILTDIQNKKELTLAAVESLRESAKKIEENIINSGRFKTTQKIFQQCPFKKNGMIFPVNGKIISRFGQGIKNIFNFQTLQNGIDIKCDRGDPIIAICSGNVIFSNWLQGYGNIIIIDHGDNFHTVYAYAEELFKQKGDSVELGEVIATVGESGPKTGPMLYFEIRHNGKPVDPLIWLKS